MNTLSIMPPPTVSPMESQLVLLQRLSEVHQAMTENHAEVCALVSRSEHYLQTVKSITALLKSSLDAIPLPSHVPQPIPTSCLTSLLDDGNGPVANADLNRMDHTPNENITSTKPDDHLPTSLSSTTIVLQPAQGQSVLPTQRNRKSAKPINFRRLHLSTSKFISSSKSTCLRDNRYFRTMYKGTSKRASEYDRDSRFFKKHRYKYHDRSHSSSTRRDSSSTSSSSRRSPTLSSRTRNTNEEVHSPKRICDFNNTIAFDRPVTVECNHINQIPLNLDLADIAVDESATQNHSELNSRPVSPIFACEQESRPNSPLMMCSPESRPISPLMMFSPEFRPISPVAMSPSQSLILTDSPSQVSSFAIGSVNSENTKIEQDPKLHINIGSQDKLVYVPEFMETLLREHQIKGISFLWRRVVIEQGGAILAHAMGLGKTMQIIAFLYILYREIRYNQLQCTPNLQRRCFLILCPKIVYPNWVNEVNKWIPIQYQKYVDLRMYVLDKVDKLNHEGLLEHWHKLGGILIASYGCFKATISSKRLMIDDCQRESRLIEAIVKKASLVIIDEAHVAKNDQTTLSTLLKTNMPSHAHCIGLTGTPLANNLDEYYRLSDLVAPGFLGPPRHFELIRNRIMKGQTYDCQPASRLAAEYALELLSHTLDEFVCRQDNSILQAALPPIHEVVVFLEPTCYQKEMVVQVMQAYPDQHQNFLTVHKLICSILNHPKIFVQRFFKKRPQLVTSAMSSVSTVSIRSNAISRHISRGGQTISESEDEIDSEPLMAMDSSNNEDELESSLNEYINEQVSRFGQFDSPELSSKTMFALDLVHESILLNEKVIIFTHWLGCVDLLINSVHKAGLNCCSLTGWMNSVDRETSITNFNREDMEFPVMLISTRTGSTGINLVRASRVIIFDFDFNPVHEEQSLSRAYRFGQSRPVYVYRFVNPGTVNDVVFKNQVYKSTLARQTLDSERYYRTYCKSELKMQIKPKDIVERMLQPMEVIAYDQEVLQADIVLAQAVCASPYVVRIEEMKTYFPKRLEPELDPVTINEARDKARQLREFIRSGLLQSAQFEVPGDDQFINDSDLFCRQGQISYSELTLPNPAGPARDYYPPLEVSEHGFGNVALGRLASSILGPGLDSFVETSDELVDSANECLSSQFLAHDRNVLVPFHVDCNDSQSLVPATRFNLNAISRDATDLRISNKEPVMIMSSSSSDEEESFMVMSSDEDDFHNKSTSKVRLDLPNANLVPCTSNAIHHPSHVYQPMHSKYAERW